MTYKFKLSRRLAASHPAWARAAGALLIVAASTACAGSSDSSLVDPTPEPTVTAGWLTVQLTNPNSNDGAVQLSISGPGLDSVRAASPYAGHGAVMSGVGNVVVTGSVGTGSVAQLWVRDLSKVAQFSANVSAAAARTTYALQDVSGYRATVVR